MDGLIFSPIAFVNNLVYMLAGMLGVFLIIGIIIGATICLQKYTGKKKKDNE